jgi:hypothetical protein
MRVGHAHYRHILARIFALGTGALIAATLVPRGPATAADQEKVLYSFCTDSGCTDGARPETGLIMDTGGEPLRNNR